MLLTPRKSLNKAFLKVKPNRSDIEVFKAHLIELIDQTNDTESEEFHKNLVADFLKKTYYAPTHFINTKGRNDLVIHAGKTAKTPVAVIIEAKKPTNRSEMLQTDKLNSKALQELVLYYLRERISHKNIDIKHLVVTNIHEWFVFDAGVFEKNFAQNKRLVKQFQDFEAGRLGGTKTDFFYKEIAQPCIAEAEPNLAFAYFDLRTYETPLRNQDQKDDNKLIALFKLFSPEHLLKLPFANDSNSSDKKFYSELLHIIGLTETKSGGKKIIERNKPHQRHAGSLLENAITQLDTLDKIHRLHKPSQYGNTADERTFTVGLELAITWVNRILFLKLLEAQLIAYHKGDRSYSFLSSQKIANYDDLNSLFFEVLAKQYHQRSKDIKQEFAAVPYLNSSLFEPTEMEHNTLMISNLRDDKKLPILSNTVLKDNSGKKRTGQLNALSYFFDFLDAYDFSSEGAQDIQEDNKTLINASVLGLIFEKINGYKDGSFFTPGFITMYMCRETIRRSVVQKFNEAKGWNCQTLDDLYDRIDNRQEANELINSLKICDPAVGSGHFLVSALNELIAIKNDLKILQDRSGKRLKEYVFEVVNDELVITDDDGELFEYTHTNQEAQRVQEALFHEKQTLIENCLFGVDINPNSVKICRLRLWIELLKHAYYKNDTELETLPNIDINIKCGNSLVSRFDLAADIKQALKKSKWSIDSYKIAVSSYRNAQSKAQKREMEQLIADIKSDFRSEISKRDPKRKKLMKLNGELALMTTQFDLFGMTAKEKKAWNKRLANKNKEIEKLELIIAEIENNQIYENAFEWRFEFPEVLNDDGEFVGFDTIIGNPPYIRQEEIKEYKPYFKERFKSFSGTADLFVYFVELGINNLKTNGEFSFIIPNKWMRANYGKPLRTFIQDKKINTITDFGDLPVFEEATTYPCILSLKKSSSEEVFKALNVEYLEFPKGLTSFFNENAFEVLADELSETGWTLTNSKVQKLLSKLKLKGKTLEEYVEGKIFRGVLTGLNEAFVIDELTRNQLIAEDPKSEEIIKPFLAGRDIKRYQSPKNSKYLIFTRRGIEIDQYPNIKKYLNQFRESLEPKPKNYEGGNWKGRKYGNYKWYEIQDAVDYYAEFEKDKIIYPNILKQPEFLIDDNSFYTNQKCFIITKFNKTFLGILNSNLNYFLFKSILPMLRGNFYEPSYAYFKSFPIVDTRSQEIEEKVTQILSLKQLDSGADTSALEAEIDRLVYQLYDLTNEEIAIVEGSV